MTHRILLVSESEKYQRTQLFIPRHHNAGTIHDTPPTPIFRPVGILQADLNQNPKNSIIQKIVLKLIVDKLVIINLSEYGFKTTLWIFKR